MAGQANLMEEALATALNQARQERSENGADRAPSWAFPVLDIDLKGKAAVRSCVSILEAPHRIFDAIFRDSVSGEERFADSEIGTQLERAQPARATALFEFCPTALVFGVWNSTKAVRGNAKFPRCVVSEIVGFHAQKGVTVGGRIDPLEIPTLAIFTRRCEVETLDEKEADHDENGKPIFRAKGEGAWTVDVEKAEKRDQRPVFRRIGDDWTARDSEACRDKDGKPIRFKIGKKTSAPLGPQPWQYSARPTPCEIGQTGRRRHAVGPARLCSWRRGNDQRSPTDHGALVRCSATTAISRWERRCDTGTRRGSTNGVGRVGSSRNHGGARLFPALTLRLAVKKESPFELIRNGAEDSEKFAVTFEQATGLLSTAIERCPLKWKTQSELPQLRPSEKLRGLIEEARKRSRVEEETAGE